jgi:hypothetical protein
MNACRLVASIVLLVLVSASQGQTLRLISPPDGATVKDEIKLAVEIDGGSSVATIQYLLNGRPISGLLGDAPYSTRWHTANVWDGDATITAVARDAGGKIVAEAKSSITIANNGATMKLLAPDITQPLSGKVTLTLEATRPMSDEEIEQRKAANQDIKPYEAILVFIDGQQIGQKHGTAKADFELDTARFADGEHELFACAYSTEPGLPPRAMLQKTLTFHNGQTRRALLPTMRELRLRPGEAGTFTVRWLLCDGSLAPADGVGARVSSGELSSESGQFRFASNDERVFTITLSADDREATVRAIVSSATGFAHLTRDGAILTEYDPERSIFVRAPFGLHPTELVKVPEWAEYAKSGGANTLTTGFYQNPADSGATDFDQWLRGWSNWWESMEKPARDHGFSILVTGDDIARTDREMHHSATSPMAAETLKAAFTKLRDSGRIVSVEMVDEVTAMWGDTPTPTDGRWQKKNPPLPDDAFITLMQRINAVENRPPMSWPMLGLSGPEAAKAWLNDPKFSDYISLYWTYLHWRHAYPWSPSLPQDMVALDRVAIGFLPAVPRPVPRLMLTSLCGPFYQKLAEGDEYQPGKDKLLQPGPSAVSCGAQVMYAAAVGMAGVRNYSFDWSLWKNDRKNAKVGAGGLQTGGEPIDVGTDRWYAVAAAFRLIQHIEPHLLQPMATAIDPGPTFAVGARASANSRLLIAVNFSEAPQEARIDLSPYRFGGSGKIARFRQCGPQLQTDLIDPTDEDTVRFAPGEAIVWLFIAPGDADRTPPAVRFVSPLPDLQTRGEIDIRLEASDDTKLAKVELFADSRLVATFDGGEIEMRHTWRAPAGRSGAWRVIHAVATDAAGNTSEARVGIRLP